MNLLPALRMISATSQGGRVTPCGPWLVASTRYGCGSGFGPAGSAPHVGDAGTGVDTPWCVPGARAPSEVGSFASQSRLPPRERVSCVLGMLSSLGVQVPGQPDGGEGLVMMQGLPPRGEV